MARSLATCCLTYGEAFHIRESQKDVSSMSENRNTSPSRVDLRDTFAAAALTGYNANPAWDNTDASIVAEQVYADADAMLRVRNGAVDARETVCPHVRGTVTQHCSLNFTLTAEERAAIESAAMSLDGTHSLDYVKRARQASTLRSLLARLA